MESVKYSVLAYVSHIYQQIAADKFYLYYFLNVEHMFYPKAIHNLWGIPIGAVYPLMQLDKWINSSTFIKAVKKELFKFRNVRQSLKSKR